MSKSYLLAVLLLTVVLAGTWNPAGAALREDVLLSPGQGWEMFVPGSRDFSILPDNQSGWSAVDTLSHPNPLTWYRKLIDIPAEWKGKRVILNVGPVAYGADVYLNGKQVGTHLGAAAAFDVDLTQAVNWKGPNVLWIASMDWSVLLDPKLDKSHNAISIESVPEKSMLGPIAYATWMIYGIYGDVRLRAVPVVRVTDVSINTSVRNWQFTAVVTIRNNDTSAHKVVLTTQITKWKDSTAVKLLPESSVTLPAHSEIVATLKLPWPDPILWRPGNPQLYSFVANIREDNVLLDSMQTRFGFREFWIEQNNAKTQSWFVLNGVRQNLRGESIWHARFGDAYVSTALDWFKANNFNIIRMCSGGMEPYYDMADEKGILTTSEMPFYFNQKYDYSNPIFWQNALKFQQDQIKYLRNHPSIVMWDIENEVLLTSPEDPIGKYLYDLEAKARMLDPTRPVMHEGDADLRDISKKDLDAPGPVFDVQVVNIHNYDVAEPGRNALKIVDFPNAGYVFGETTPDKPLPGFAYGKGIPDKSKPWYIGEFGPGCVINSPFAQAFLTGDKCFEDLFGKADGLYTAEAMNYGFQIEGYRYFSHVSGFAAWDTYRADPLTPLGPKLRDYLKPVCMRIKEYTHNFRSGQRLDRTVTVYNDDVLAPSKFILSWRLEDGSQTLLRDSTRFTAQSGVLTRLNLNFTCPNVSQRHDMRLVLDLSLAGVRVDNIVQDISIFPTKMPLQTPAGMRVMIIGNNSAQTMGKLTNSGIAVTRYSLLREAVRTAPGLIIVPPNSLADQTLTQSDIESIRLWIQKGGTILVDGPQTSIPWFDTAVSDVKDVDSTIAFIRSPHNPLMANIQKDDLKWWAKNHYVTKGNWVKPSTGAVRAIVDTGGRNQGLGDTPLCEIPDGMGSTILCRLLLFDKLDLEPICKVLLQNLLNYAASAVHNPLRKPVCIVAAPESPMLAVLSRIGVHWELMGSTENLAERYSVIMIANEADVWLGIESNRALLREFVNRGGAVYIHRLDSVSAPYVSALTGVNLQTHATSLQHPQLERRGNNMICDGLSNWETFWPYLTDWRTQAWSQAIVTDVISPAIGGSVEVLYSEPARTGTLPTDAGQQYPSITNNGVTIASPGAGLVRISQPGAKGFYLIDQVEWDTVGIPDIQTRSDRYISTLLTNCGADY